MFRVVAGEHFLLLSSVVADGEATDFELSIHNDANSALKAWRESSRISPIWEVRQSGLDQERFDFESTRSVLFLSALSPGRFYGMLPYSTVQELKIGQLWLGLGAYNLIIFSPTIELTHEIIELCNRNQFACEEWSVTAATSGRTFDIEGIEYIYPLGVDDRGASLAEATAQSDAIEAISHSASLETTEIDYSIFELKALLAVVKGRSRTNFPELAKDCTEIVRAAELSLQDPSLAGEEAAPQRLDMLLSLNAGLSRLVSQAFSGTTPITRTECHFWPHSLLGIGIANVALRNLAHFVSRIVKETGYQSRYFRLLKSEDQKKLGGVVDAIERRSTQADPEFLTGCLLDELKAISDDEIDNTFVPTPITYYSGRDGFRNNLLTTSAPLLSVTGCNSVQWNLGTITHELSHRIVASKLHDAYEDIFEWAGRTSKSKDRKKSFSKAKPLMLPHHAESTEHSTITTVRELVCFLMARTLLALHSKEFDSSDWKKMQICDLEEFYRDSYEAYSEEIEEFVVHLFDFYHFYSMNADTYVSYVWRSWAVQPTIEKKLETYVKRTLISLSAKYYAYPDWISRAYTEMRRIFDPNDGLPKLPFVKRVNQILDESQGELEHFLEISTYLIGLFLAVFRSERLRAAASSEPLRNPSRGKNYSVSHQQFYVGNEAVSQSVMKNPLLFVRDYSQIDEPSSAQSIWLLHLLALHYEDDKSKL
ncbi:MAG TPA: hypothetical protein VNJ01_13690 [Bacteriovoracaceae bacterium]|nr:hypothetical protein [Bacteriovoracaceae bacterium]